MMYIGRSYLRNYEYGRDSDWSIEWWFDCSEIWIDVVTKSETQLRWLGTFNRNLKLTVEALESGNSAD